MFIGSTIFSEVSCYQQAGVYNYTLVLKYVCVVGGVA